MAYYNHHKYFELLKSGNRLCETREMTPKLMKQIKDIHRKCWRHRPNEVIDASRYGFDHMVWGFIQYAKHINKDLQWMLCYKRPDGETALHAAARGDHFEVVKLLLEEESVHLLIFDKNDQGETPVSLLRDPKYDEYILTIMKATKKEKGAQVLEPPSSIAISIDKKHQESIVYNECIMDLNSYPKSHKNESRSSLDNLNKGVCELTHPNRNTILHLVCKFGDIDYAKDILKEHSSLIHYENSDGETPLYVAAREGHIDILNLWINYARPDELVKLATRSTDKYNALHIAIQNHHTAVVFWLVKEIPQLANLINDLNVSPLYLVAERNYYHILTLILDECKEKAFDGPDGKTALHASVVIATDCTPHLLRENKGQLYIHDKYGWTPLHYAAYYDNPDTIRQLLLEDPNIGFQMTTGDDKNNSAMQIAASRGNQDSMKVIMSKCPQCSEIVDSKGMNILHIAVENKKRDVIKLVFEDASLTGLINQRDSNGNTPIHLYMASDIEAKKMVVDHRVNIHVRNNDNLTPLEMTSTDQKREKLIKAMATRITGSEDYPPPPPLEDDSEPTRQMLTRLGDNVALVVTLIATATFAAAFTVPGGFDGNESSDQQGMPILLGQAAYKAFVVANAIAFSCSCCVLAAYIRLQFYLIDVKEYDNKSQVDSYYIITLQYFLTGIAMVAMGVAFVTGSYVILAPSLGLAISLCTTCLCIMVPFSLLPREQLRFIMELFRKY